MIMKLPQWLKRILCLLIVVSMLPVAAPHIHAAQANEIVDAAVIFSDLHTNKNDYKESTVKSIMTAVKNAGLPVSSVTSAGDAFSVNEDNSSSNGPYTGKTSTITSYIQNVFGNVPVNYVWSDHDRYAVQADGSTLLDKTSRLVYGAGNDGVYGTADDGNYYIYSLSMGDLCSYDRYKAAFNYTASNNSGRVSAGFTPTVEQAIANFQADTAKLNNDRPLFIVSHQPLFDNRNDNAWAGAWFDAINAVAAEMDVAFFYGHNHKYDSGSDYYYAKGSTLPVAIANNWNYNYEVGVGYKPSIDLKSENRTLNFTHLCGGYMEPTSTGSYSNTTTRKGTVVAITIYEDSICYTTYDSKGVYTGNFAVNVSVPRDHAAAEAELVISGTDTYFVGQELDITAGYKEGSNVTDVTSAAQITGYDMNVAADQTVAVSFNGLTAQFPIRVRHQEFTDHATGITATVEVPGATALSVEILAADDAAFDQAATLLSKAAGYRINLADLTEGTATVTLPIPAGVTAPAVYRLSDGGFTRIDAAKSGNSVSFTASSFGTILIGQEELTEDPENSVTGNGSAYEEKTVYVKVDTFENGGKYLIVGEDKASNGNPIAYLNNSGSEGWEIVTIDSNSIEISNPNAVWTATGSASSGFTLENNGSYIGGTDANTLKSKATEAVKVTYDASAARLKTASGTTRYLYYSTYNSENWKWSTSANSSSSSRKMMIFKEETIQVSTSSPITYTLQASNLNHTLTSNTAQLQYALLADGAAAELPAGGNFSFEVVNDGIGIIDSISNEGLVTFSNVEGSCYVKISYTWSEGTVYKYVKVTAEADPNACDHSYTSVITAATCTEDGFITYTCACGDTYTEVIPATGHSHKSSTTGATCTTDGKITYTCACGDSYVEVIPAIGHKYTAVVTAPTCTEDGYTTYTCSCGDTYVSDKTAALGHTYETTTVDATCGNEGSVTYLCHCGDSYTEVVPALGHTYTASVTAPTCTESGYTTYICACGKSYTANEVAALGHDYKIATVDATCGADGSVTKTCQRCGETITEVIPATGKHNYEAVVTAPTCTESGYTTYTCFCGASYTADEVAALGHDYKTVTVDATCTADGSVTKTCQRCDETVTEVIPTTGHDYKTVTVDATCTTDGSVTKTCQNCGETVAEVIPARGHDHKASITAPTCTENGYTTYACSCGNTYVADEVAALGHNYVTSEQNGTLIRTCGNCGHSEVISEPLENSVTTGSSSYEEKTVYVKADAFENGGKYLLIGEDKASNGNPIAYLNNSGSEGWEIVTIDSDNIEISNPNAVWTATGSASEGFTLENNGRYVGGTNANTLKSKAPEAVKVVYDAPAARLKTASGTTRYLYYSTYGSENWKWATSANSSSSSRKMMIFKEEILQISTSTTVTYTMQASDLQHVLTSNTAQLQYALLADGTAAELPAGGSYRFEVKDDSQGIISGISNQGIISFSGAEGSCYVKVSYTWSEGTVYKYVKVTVEAVCEHRYEATTTAPTCTEDGSTVYTCTCGDTYTELIPATGHSYSSVESNGYTVYTCGNCGHSYSEKLTSSYTKVSSIASGNRYVITVTSGTKHYALSHAGNKVSVVNVTVSNNQVTSDVTEDLLWDYSDNKLSYASNGSTYYLYASGSSLTLSTSKSSAVSFSTNKLKIGTNYLRYSANKISLNRKSTTTSIFIEE